ncbi:MAG: hypothetical protein H0W76_08340 [Pyrinomonadaceae bacterium]|nr:hypothetical protein [Pyrinomonadaceae bacterium]
MIQTQAFKIVPLTPPAAIIDNASLATAEIDTAGFSYCDVYVWLAATDIAITALKVQESDVSGSGMVDITGLVFGATGAPALPSATDDNKLYGFHIDCRGGRKRFLDLVATVGDGTVGAFVAAFAILSRAAEAPNTAAERGLAAELFV